ncbi:MULTISPECIES: dihydrolipoyllysine-residue acetyltransferase [unclassified Shewanella]|uniref:dihydrolipoyllysine-residue acetyltransferase n=1 Tax=Shewanella TaxID=22 RepID=UPI0015631DDF|nr:MULTISPECIES: dihydrolipoyllysine-residue acetyltransferase [unclassified Shewanella]MBW3513148.1 dihydrolipoyllysine-residue acetyltransferase [Shewanella sp. NKUCC01_JLK]MCU8041621.1 dihydrolipoyllysine-residue acetyltransferase [Shewanella sp. SM68]MCU8046485.1 dihydrolipoyllysine-residue acetyltransferase [Shewanella sp. SM65]MCU8086433.1 dihydrolipoyllysine-residue acetyltransferase [Shewanella sp. SM21]NRD32037.1 dihydrolipoyllysine-residue acetyltransferase [Shewanella sp. DC2-4]
MIKDFILPDIGEGVVECELVEWLVKEGDTVVEDQPIADVMTDKALVQIPAPFAGVVTKLYYAKGDIAKVHAPLYAVQIEGAVEIAGEESVAAAAATIAKAAEPVAVTNATTSSSSSVSIEEFLLPDIGEGIVECELVEWLVSEGDWVEEDQPIADVMTDKALVQIPAIKAGKIAKLHYRKGQLAKVHAPLFAIEVEQAASAPAATTNTDNAAPAAQAVSAEPARQGKALASPAVRRMARSLDIDLSQVPGTGKHGRVYKEDITRFQQGASNVSAPSVAQVKEASVQATQASQTQVPTSTVTQRADTVEPIRGVKAVMARMMVESVSSIPHFTYCEEFDLTDLVALRESMKVKYSSDEVKLTMMPFFMKSMSLALSQFPVMNSQVNADCTELTYKARHNIGMAVDSKVGLLVPNIKDVQDKSILEVAAEITRLTQAARSGRVAPADLKDGTISISNIGALGGTVATPIINKPEVAIVALGKLQTLPRFNAKGEVEARQIMQVSWSGDHRVIDGGTIARFCNLWKQYLEQPQEMLLAMR